MKNLIKLFSLLLLLGNTTVAWGHQDIPPSNDESLEDARERERNKEHHDHDHNHDHDHDHHHHSEDFSC